MSRLAGYKNVCECDHMTCSRQKGILSALVKIDIEKTTYSKKSFLDRDACTLLPKRVVVDGNTTKNLVIFPIEYLRELCPLSSFMYRPATTRAQSTRVYAHLGLSSIRIASSLSQTRDVVMVD